MRVGILGSGLMGGKLGTLFARAGHEVTFSYARGRKKLEKLARHSPAGTDLRLLHYLQRKSFNDRAAYTSLDPSCEK